MKFLSLALLLVLLLLGCAAPQETNPRTPTGTTPPTFSPPTTFSPGPPTKTASIPTEKPTDFPTTAPSPAATLTPSPFEVCSPLRDYALAELPDIISRGFIPPRPGGEDGHHGVDFAHYRYKDKLSIGGEIITPIFPGIVSASIEDSWPYGNFIIIESPLNNIKFSQINIDSAGRSLYHLYAHMQTPSDFQIGDKVICGDELGLVGNTGWSGNVHLHLETRIGPAGVVFESMRYYQTTTTEIERANYERWRFGGDFEMRDPMLFLNSE